MRRAEQRIDHAVFLIAVESLLHGGLQGGQATLLMVVVRQASGLHRLRYVRSYNSSDRKNRPSASEASLKLLKRFFPDTEGRRDHRFHAVVGQVPPGVEPWHVPP